MPAYSRAPRVAASSMASPAAKTFVSPTFWLMICPAIRTPEMTVRLTVPSKAPLTASAMISISIRGAPGSVAGIPAIVGAMHTATTRAARMRTRNGMDGSPKPGSSRNAAPMRTNTRNVRKTSTDSQSESESSAMPKLDLIHRTQPAALVHLGMRDHRDRRIDPLHQCPHERTHLGAGENRRPHAARSGCRELRANRLDEFLRARRRQDERPLVAIDDDRFVQLPLPLRR